MSSLFNTKRGIRGLLVLFVGIIVLSLLGLMLLGYYLKINRRNVSVTDAQRAVIAWAVQASHSNTRRLTKIIAADNHTWLRVDIRRNPLPNAPTVQSSDIWSLQQMLEQQAEKIMLNIEIKRHGYLVIRGHKPDHIWQNSAVAFCFVVLLFLLLMLCYWIIQYISTPLDPLLKALQRFGHDIKAPNISLQGSAEMQTIIRAFNTMQDNIRQLVQDRTQMLAAISHDLRTPITRLKLRAEYISDESLRQKIIRDLDDIEKMIASLLAFARQQNSDEAEQVFDIDALLESICDDYIDIDKPVSYHGVQQRVKFTGRMLSLKRAFINLIDNAIKYGENCDISLQSDDKNISIRFQDNGPGIPADQLQQVLQPFFRVNTARSPTIPGSGLGLTVTAEVIESHNGLLKLENKQQGLLVELVLPRENLS